MFAGVTSFSVSCSDGLIIVGSSAFLGNNPIVVLVGRVLDAKRRKVPRMSALWGPWGFKHPKTFTRLCIGA